MVDTVRWGVLGASNFALNVMARAINEAEGATLAAIATSDASKAAPFQSFCPALKVFTEYTAMLESGEIDAVYIPLPNHLHVEWALKAMDAGLHVLCEKPIGLQVSDLDQLIAVRDAKELFCAEAFMIVHHPQWQRAQAAIAAGDLGELVHIDGAFTYFNPDMGNIRNRPETGGGSLRDIGVYTLGSAHWASGRDLTAITHTQIDTENGVDVTARVTADFDGVSFHGYTSMRMANFQQMRFHGTKATMTLRTPFNASAAGPVELSIQDAGGNLRVENFTPVRQYVLQVENASRAIGGARADYPWPLEEARKTQAILDAVFAHDQRR